MLDIGAIPAAGLMTWIWAALAGIDTGARTSEWLLSLLVSLLMGAVFWGRDKVPTVTVISPSSSAIALFDHPSLIASSVQIAAIFALIAAVRLSTGHGNPPEFTDLAAWFLASQMVFAGQRTAMRYAKTHLNKTGILDEQIAIVGAGQQSDLLAELIDQSGYRGYHLFGVFDDRKSRLDGLRYPPRGDIDDLARMGRDAAIDRVIIALPYEAETRIIDLTQRLKSIAADIYLGLREPFSGRLQRTSNAPVGLQFLPLVTRPISRRAALAKRMEDLFLGGALCLAALPVMMIVAVLIKLDSRGPVLFRQKRYGFNNRVIEIFKFRSMQHEQSDPSGGRQTKQGDDRCTRVGRFIRRTSLDELPQLFNVLLGDMSLVGPRPLPVGMRTCGLLNNEIAEDFAHRHRVKPGITGWAQINGHRGATETTDSVRQRVALDLDYIENWSVGFDLKILFMTAVSLIRDDTVC